MQNPERKPILLDFDENQRPKAKLMNLELTLIETRN